jgi:calpain-7
MSPNGGLVWVLVCRHFVNDELEISRKRSDSMAAASRQLGFMSILVFDSNGKGKRVQVPDGETYRGPYVDSPQTLARLDTSAGRYYTIVLDQHELPLSSYTLTLSTFSQNPVRIQEAAEPMSHIKELTGVWDRRTAGGNAACSTYFLNPQYCISVSEATPLSILLTTDSRDIHVHVDVVWAHGKRATAVRQRDILMSSGEYRRGCVVAEVPYVDPGDYSIVCSTFEAGQAAGFALRVTSMAAVRVEPIPADAAGRLQTPVGPFNLSTRVDKLRVQLSAQWLTRASACIHTGVSPGSNAGHRSTPLPLVRLSIVCGRGPHQSTIAMSGDGEFQEVSVPLRTPEFDIEPGRAKVEGMWLLVEGIGMQDGPQVLHGEVFSDSSVNIGNWEALDSF